MEEFINKDQLKLKLIAWYEIAGGFLGLCLVIWLIATTGTITGITLLIFALAIGLYSFSIFCGIQLFKNPLKLGLTISIINQILQIINFSIFGLGYKYIAGILITFGIDYTSALKSTMNFSVSTFQIIINQEKEVFTVGINIVAAFLAYSLDKLKNKTELISQAPKIQS
jgi:hypothetical protein